MEKKFAAAYKAQETFMPNLQWDWKPLSVKRSGAVVLARVGGKKAIPHGIRHWQRKEETLCGQSITEPGVMAIHYKLNWLASTDDVNCATCLRKKAGGEAKAKKVKGPKLTAEQAMVIEEMTGDDVEDEEPELIDQAS